jgi:transposase
LAEEIQKYTDTIHKCIRGVVNHATHQPSREKLEGTNNLMKTVYRASWFPGHAVLLLEDHGS